MIRLDISLLRRVQWMKRCKMLYEGGWQVLVSTFWSHYEFERKKQNFDSVNFLLHAAVFKFFSVEFLHWVTCTNVHAHQPNIFVCGICIHNTAHRSFDSTRCCIPGVISIYKGSAAKNILFVKKSPLKKYAWWKFSLCVFPGLNRHSSISSAMQWKIENENNWKWTNMYHLLLVVLVVKFYKECDSIITSIFLLIKNSICFASDEMRGLF